MTTRSVDLNLHSVLFNPEAARRNLTVFMKLLERGVERNKHVDPTVLYGSPDDKDAKDITALPMSTLMRDREPRNVNNMMETLRYVRNEFYLALRSPVRGVYTWLMLVVMYCTPYFITMVCANTEQALAELYFRDFRKRMDEMIYGEMCPKKPSRHVAQTDVRVIRPNELPSAIVHSEQATFRCIQRLTRSQTLPLPAGTNSQ